MPRPVLLAVDGDPAAQTAILGELHKRYGADYQVLSAGSGAAGLEALEQVKVRGGEGWGDKQVGDRLVRAAVLGQVDDWGLRPWQPGGEGFHQLVVGLLHEWAQLHRPGFQAVQVVGDQRSARAHELRDLLARNNVRCGYLPADSEEGRSLLGRVGATATQLPVVVTFDGLVLRDPSFAEVAEALSAPTRPAAATYDVTVVGAGPAGLAAAMYGASEGLGTVVLEPEATGGQAGTSSMIRNYLGFPRGVSGTELAYRAFHQAIGFGADIVYGQWAVALQVAGFHRVVTLGDGTEVTSRAVILATGMRWRRLGVPSLEALVGAGGVLRRRRLRSPGDAGRAGVHDRWGQLRRPGGGAPGPVRRPGHPAGPPVHPGSDHVRLPDPGASGRPQHRGPLPHPGRRRPGRRPAHRPDPRGPRLGSDHHRTGDRPGRPDRAEPHTGWLPETIRRDRWGFVVTETDLLGGDGRPPAEWRLERPPMPSETSLPGVFAAGDVRHRSIKRVAAAVGEGSAAIRTIHQYLSQE